MILLHPFHQMYRVVAMMVLVVYLLLLVDLRILWPILVVFGLYLLLVLGCFLFCFYFVIWSLKCVCLSVVVVPLIWIYFVFLLTHLGIR